jgi:hypothetical protein
VQRDDALMPKIEQICDAWLPVYGVDKRRKQMNRESVAVALCTVERLRRRLGLSQS